MRSLDMFRLWRFIEWERDVKWLCKSTCSDENQSRQSTLESSLQRTGKVFALLRLDKAILRNIIVRGHSNSMNTCLNDSNTKISTSGSRKKCISVGRAKRRSSRSRSDGSRWRHFLRSDRDSTRLRNLQRNAFYREDMMIEDSKT